MCVVTKICLKQKFVMNKNPKSKIEKQTSKIEKHNFNTIT